LQTRVGEQWAHAFGEPVRLFQVRVAHHHGQYFDVRGPLGSARSPQGRPVLFQAGSSPTGRRFAARHAEVIFTGQGTRDRAQQFYRQIQDEAHREGRGGQGN
jgi:alkanesulfonate monooxygenase SsuD/methylene tetrahydromethanopterin reductase-like flavin-dependent oxidoreductase (luciferase family)